MRKSTKIWLIVATSLILVGAAIFTAALAKCDWDFTNLSTDEFQTQIYTSNSPITDITITSTTADVTFCLSEDNSIKVVCYEMEDAPHRVSFNDGTLVVEQNDLRKWYDHIGIHFDCPKITVYLPKTEYGKLTIDITTGDIELANAEFDSVVLLATTGDMTLTNVKSEIIYTSGTTGDITLNSVVADKSLNINRTTGDVILKDSDADTICIQLGTGNVSGNLLTGKIFAVETTTGKISVPQNAPGGTCVITTTTGDIFIT